MLINKQSRFTMRNRVNICSPMTNPNPEQISARQLAKLAGELHRPWWVQSSEPESKQLL
uniref:Uncharacterized protein n=1 Tax=Piliocolobus tephrosceles TaxID=591936 RepID=A0A8C9GYD4_9PRIM